jgi:hypothetical protein
MKKCDVPDVPDFWFSEMENAGPICDKAYIFFPCENDDRAIRILAKRYRLPRSRITRILLRNALAELEEVSLRVLPKLPSKGNK